MIAGVEPGWLPCRDRIAAGYGRDVSEVAEQAAQHALRLGVYTRNGKHSLAGGAQDPVLGDVRRELVVADLQRERQPVMATQLLALAQPTAQHLGALLDDDVAREQALMDGSFGLPPQRLRDDRDEVRGLRDRYRVRLPRGGMLGVAEEEQQPGDLDLRLDADLDIADPGRADLARRADQPDSRAIGRWRGGYDA